MGAELKIDTIILQHEISEFRVVSEILDTRVETYSHLFRTTTPRLWYTPSEKYPAVWFTDNGFVTGGDITHNFKIDTSDLNIVKV